MCADFKSAVIWPSALRSSESTQAVDPTPQRLPPSVVGAHLAIAPSMTRIRRSGRRRKSRGTCARTGPESGWRISHNDHGRMVRPASGLGDVPLPGRCRTSRREGSLSAPTTHHRHPALSVRRESAALSHSISATQPGQRHSPANCQCSQQSQLNQTRWCRGSGRRGRGFESRHPDSVMSQDIRIAVNLRLGSQLFLWAATSVGWTAPLHQSITGFGNQLAIQLRHLSRHGAIASDFGVDFEPLHPPLG